MMGSLRAFIAIELPQDIRNRLAQVQAELQMGLPSGTKGAKWVDPQVIHLTLKFLGNVAEGNVAEGRREAIAQALARACAKASPFKVEVKGVGGFPSLDAPRVLWVGLDGGEALARLQALVEAEMAPLGFPKEARPFTPHLTLARLEGARDGRRLLGQRADRSALAVESLGFFQAAEVSLMQSTLTPRGAHHTRLAAFPLAGP